MTVSNGTTGQRLLISINSHDIEAQICISLLFITKVN